MNWLRPTVAFQPLRTPDDDGAGGGSGESERNSALEARLASISTTLNSVLEQNAARDKQNQTQAEAEVERRVTAALKDAEGAVDKAQSALETALDDGDAKQIAAGHRAVAEAIAAREGVRADAANVKTALEARRKQAAEAPKTAPNTDNLNAWKSRHKAWYGVDQEMTQEAHDQDRKIRASGVIAPGSEAYFNAIDQHMKSKYPDKLGGSPAGDSMNGGGGGGGGTGAPKNGSTRIAAPIAAGYERMGIDMSDPVVVERMIKNRQTAVDKGLLPQQPVIARVRA